MSERSVPKECGDQNTDAETRCNDTKNGMLSPVDFEIRQQKLKQAGV